MPATFLWPFGDVFNVDFKNWYFIPYQSLNKKKNFQLILLEFASENLLLEYLIIN